MAWNGIGGLNSYIDPSAAGSVSGTDLTGKLKNVKDTASAENLKEVCKEFESYFMEQVYKEMLKSIDTDDENKDASMSSLVNFFQDGVLQTVAAKTTEQNGGPLAQQLYEQMKRNYGIVEES
ncbi:MAG: hypothetical protein HFH35_09610 [Eubacterium sp.]|nr:hypothetical protein [Eubacterium sp.]